jgi:hypothetical protein
MYMGCRNVPWNLLKVLSLPRLRKQRRLHQIQEAINFRLECLLIKIAEAGGIASI